jgi:DNA polymerase II small subunit
MEDSFDLLMDWLNGRGVSPSDKNMVRNLRYLFIAGDMVDGISVYPSQREHLRITSNIDQYALLASKLKKLPSHIKIFCIPGNHDACRQALPRPPIPEEFATPLYKLKNVEMLGGPSQITVEGIKILMTHGDSLDDLVTNLPGASYVTPAAPMIELIKKRHLAPIYGGKTELAPLHRDWLVMEDIPDVVHFGHAHHNAVEEYRRIWVINSGTFQAQTDFMRKQGIVPTPAIVTVMNLQTRSVDLRDFLGEHVKPIQRVKSTQ